MEDSFRCANALIDDGVIEVSFGGGESLLIPHFPLVARRLADSGIWVSFNTHGGLDIDRFLLPALEIPFTSIGVSLDSSKESEHDYIRGDGIFRNAINSAEQIVKSGHNLRIITVLTSSNAHEVAEISKLACHLGANEIQFKTLKESGSALGKIAKIDLTLSEKLNIWNALTDLQLEMPQLLINFGQDSDPLANHYYGDKKLLSCNC